MSTAHRMECLKELLTKIAATDCPTEVHEAASKVQQEFKDAIDGNDVFIVWNIADVHSIVNENDEGEDKGENVLTDEEAREVLHNVERRHDACIGVNWTSIHNEALGLLSELQAETEKAVMTQEVAAASAMLNRIAAELREAYPSLSVTFNHTGYLGRRSDERSWRFSFTAPNGAQPRSFGTYPTKELPAFVAYMEESGRALLENILKETVNQTSL